VQKCLSTIIGKSKSGDRVAIITHPSVIQIILNAVILGNHQLTTQDLIIDKVNMFDIDEASYSEVTLTNKGWQINCINNTAHLSTTSY
jgi:broad specificity phosphatase PhoE